MKPQKCLACDFYCCAGDELEECGCDNCPNPECWPKEENTDDDFDLGLDAE